MLKSFTLKNFKSFKEATLHLTPTVTFLIGANGSGKSNALEALTLLKWLGHGKLLKEIENDVNSVHPLIRCPSNELFNWFDGNSFEIDCTLEVEKDVYDFSIAIQNDKHGKLIYKKESLVKGRDKEIVYTTENEEKNTQNIKTLINIAQKISEHDGQTLFSLLIAVSNLLNLSNISGDVKESLNSISKVTEQIRNHFSSIFFLEPNPKGMRGYVRQIERMTFNESGENLSAVLEELCRDEKVKQNILEIVRSLPEQEVIDINFSKTDENFMMVKLEEAFSYKHHKTLAYSLSDGTLRVLAIATALYSVPKGSLLVIEEVDNGIHPSRIKHLVDKMYEIAAERKIQILVTTHDSAMMDAIPSTEKGNVLCCYRDKEDGCSKVVRLSDSPQYIDILTNGRLGSLVASPKFDDFIKKTPEERQKEHDAWVEQYKKEQEEYHKALKKALGEE
jgi:predicted ATPase